MRLCSNSRRGSSGCLPNGVALFWVLAALCPGIATAADQLENQFEQQIQPILEDRCYACHGNGEKKGTSPSTVSTPIGRGCAIQTFGGVC